MHRVQFVQLMGRGMLALADETTRRLAERGFAYEVETGGPREVSAS